MFNILGRNRTEEHINFENRIMAAFPQLKDLTRIVLNGVCHGYNYESIKARDPQLENTILYFVCLTGRDEHTGRVLKINTIKINGQEFVLGVNGDCGELNPACISGNKNYTFITAESGEYIGFVDTDRNNLCLFIDFIEDRHEHPAETWELAYNILVYCLPKLIPLLRKYDLAADMAKHLKPSFDYLKLAKTNETKKSLLQYETEVSNLKKVCDKLQASPDFNTHAKSIISLFDGVRVGEGQLVFEEVIGIYDLRLRYEITMNSDFCCHGKLIEATTPSGKKMRMSLSELNSVPNHPHINSTGGICYGNLSGALSTSVAYVDIVSILLSTRQILRSYCHENPYIRRGHLYRAICDSINTKFPGEMDFKPPFCDDRTDDVCNHGDFIQPSDTVLQYKARIGNPITKQDIDLADQIYDALQENRGLQHGTIVSRTSFDMAEKECIERAKKEASK